MNVDDRDTSKRIGTARAVGSGHASVLMLGVCFLTGMLLVLGQLLPGGTQQVASGESLPQSLLWLLVGALYATDRVLARFVSVQGRLVAAGEESSASIEQRWAILLGVGLLAWVGMSTCNVYGHGNLRFAVNGCWQWIAWAAAIFVFSRIMIYPRIQRSVQWLMITLAWLVAMHGFYQVFVSLPADRERFRLNPQEVIRELGIDAPAGSSTYLLFEQRLQDDSPTGPFALTNSLAGFLVPWILVLFAQAFRSEAWSGHQGFRRLFGFLVAVCLCLCLLWTKSRTGWIALAVGGFAIIAGNPSILNSVFRSWQGLLFGSVPSKHLDLPEDVASRLGRRFQWRVPPNLVAYLMPLMILVGLVITAVVVGLRTWDPKLFNEAGRSLAFRSEYWRTTMRMVADYPWLGVGPGNFQSHYAIYKPELESETIADPHNFLLETLATAGWPALLLLVATAIALLRPMMIRAATYAVEESSGRGKEKHREISVRAGGLRNWLFALLIGAIVGAMAIWFSNGALGPMPDLTPYMFTIPVAIAALGLSLAASERSSDVSDQTTLAAVGYGPALLAVLVHLLASGGWMTPGIGNTIAILVAGLWVAGNRSEQIANRESIASENVLSESSLSLNPSVSSFGALMVAWLLVVAFYLSAWLPKQRSEQVEADRVKAGQIDESLAIAMLKADPWSPIGYRWLADVRLGQVLREAMSGGTGTVALMDKFQESAQAYFGSDRVNWETCAQLGHWELVLSPFHKESLNRALDYYREATRRAPGDVGLLAQAALAAWLLGDGSAEQEFLSRAEHIDSKVTHLDRKLAKAILYWPENVGPPSTRVAPGIWKSARETNGLPVGWVRAEPVVRFLRSQLTQNPERSIR